MSEPPTPHALNYSNAPNELSKFWRAACIGMGILVGWATLFALQVVWVIYNFGSGSSFEWHVPSVVTLGAIGFIALVSFLLHRSMQSWLFVKSLGIGVLLCLLLDGVCFLAN